MDALAARERELLEIDAALERQQQRVMDEADQAIQVQESRLHAVLGGHGVKGKVASGLSRLEVRDEDLYKSTNAKSSAGHGGNKMPGRPAISPLASPPLNSPTMSPLAAGPLTKLEGSRSGLDENRRSRSNNNNSRASSRGGTSKSSNIPGSPTEIGPDAVIRLQRAKMKTMSEDLTKAQERVKTLQEQVSLNKKSSSNLKDENSKLSKRCASLEAARDRTKDDNARLKERISSLESELVAATREAKATDRSARLAESEGNSKDVRLHRALDEIAGLKQRLKKAEGQARQSVDGVEADLKRMRSENARLERQKQELVAAFRKQLKLIDVLKRQKIHLEAAKMLSFTEDEFTRTLEAAN